MTTQAFDHDVVWYLYAVVGLFVYAWFEWVCMCRVGVCSYMNGYYNSIYE
jgi:hypothetical protein